MSSRARSGIFLVVLLVVAVGGFVSGTRLGERASEPGTETLEVDRPSAAVPRDVALRSPAGFTGFEEGALGGLVTRSGLAELEPDAEGIFTVVTDSATLRVRTLSPARLYRIVALEGPLAAGDIVVVRTAEDGTAEAILRIPPDLREGDSR
ncbi:MAG: hypothetical protein DWG80_02615 [Chloroflexi bacterium]|nr:hypothetical protein [Chloroflexota bacterium]